jgi:hypothetical protein
MDAMDGRRAAAVVHHVHIVHRFAGRRQSWAFGAAARKNMVVNERAVAIRPQKNLPPPSSLQTTNQPSPSKIICVNPRNLRIKKPSTTKQPTLKKNLR